MRGGERAWERRRSRLRRRRRPAIGGEPTKQSPPATGWRRLPGRHLHHQGDGPSLLPRLSEKLEIELSGGGASRQARARRQASARAARRRPCRKDAVSTTGPPLLPRVATPPADSPTLRSPRGARDGAEVRGGGGGNAFLATLPCPISPGRLTLPSPRAPAASATPSSILSYLVPGVVRGGLDDLDVTHGGRIEWGGAEELFFGGVEESRGERGRLHLTARSIHAAITPAHRRAPHIRSQPTPSLPPHPPAQSPIHTRERVSSSFRAAF
jgi:hypothetical protein